MPMRVHVHAAIWIDDHVVVHRRTTRGREHITLPGGRVREREAVLTALEREVGEETGLDITVGALCLAGEVHGAAANDLILVFQAQPRGDVDPDRLHLLAPGSDEADKVRPAVVDLLHSWRAETDWKERAGTVSWIGNLYQPG